MTIYRARVCIDLLYEADKPLSSPLLTRIANRTGTYVRTGAVEELDGKKIVVLFQEHLRNQHSHHHEAQNETCRACYLAAKDHLGSIDE